MTTPSDLDTRFNFHPASTKTGVRHDLVRNCCRDLANILVDLTPAGREQALALTKLEEAMMWANAAIARNPGGPFKAQE